MKKIICVVCPNGCELSVDDNGNIMGNRCLRGLEFAKQELTMPLRSLSSTIKTIFPNIPVVPVKVNKPIPKDKIFMVMKEINQVRLDKRLNANDIIIKNIAQTGADLVLVSDILKEDK